MTNSEDQMRSVEQEITDMLKRIVKISELMSRQSNIAVSHQAQIELMNSRINFLEASLDQLVRLRQINRGENEAVKKPK